MDIVERLFEESQDNPESLYWIAAQEITNLRDFKNACEEQEDLAVKAVNEQCVLAESCWVEGNIRKTLKNICEYWFSLGMDEQQSALETSLVLDLRQQVAKLTEQRDMAVEALLTTNRYLQLYLADDKDDAWIIRETMHKQVPSTLLAIKPSDVKEN